LTSLERDTLALSYVIDPDYQHLTTSSVSCFSGRDDNGYYYDLDSPSSLSYCSSNAPVEPGSPLLRSVGSKLWSSSAMLAPYLVATQPPVGRTVLELGAGTGVCGLVAHAMCGPSKVVHTDGDPKALKLLRHNLALNQGQSQGLGPRPSRAQVLRGKHAHLLSWSSRADTRKPLAAHGDVAAAGGFDVVIGSDILYEERAVTPLWGTVGRLLRHSDATPAPVFILAYEDRFSGLLARAVAVGIAAGFACEHVAAAGKGVVPSGLIDLGVSVEPGSGDWAKIKLLLCHREAAPTR